MSVKSKFVSKATNFHKEAMEAAHNIAEEKQHNVTLNWKHFDKSMFKAQVRVFLCQKYSYSANSSEHLINRYLNCIQAENCL